MSDSCGPLIRDHPIHSTPPCDCIAFFAGMGDVDVWVDTRGAISKNVRTGDPPRSLPFLLVWGKQGPGSWNGHTRWWVDVGFDDDFASAGDRTLQHPPMWDELQPLLNAWKLTQ